MHDLHIGYWLNERQITSIRTASEEHKRNEPYSSRITDIETTH